MSAGTAAAGCSNNTARDWAILIRDRLGEEVERHAEYAESDPRRTIFRVREYFKRILDKNDMYSFTPEKFSLGLFHRPGRYNAPQAGEDFKLKLAGAFLISIYTKQCSDLPQINETLERLLCDSDFAQEFPGLSEVPMESIAKFLTLSRRDRVWRDVCYHVVGQDKERNEGQERTSVWKETVDCYDLQGDDCIKPCEPTDVLQSAFTLDAILVGLFLSGQFRGKENPFPLVRRCLRTVNFWESLKDIVKLENQIPLKLLERVFSIIWTDTVEATIEAKEVLNDACANLVQKVANAAFPGFDRNYHFAYIDALFKEKKFLDCDHLLGCCALLLSEQSILEARETPGSEEHKGQGRAGTKISSLFARSVSRFWVVVFGSNKDLDGVTSYYFQIPSATVLHEAGIHLRGCASGPGFDLKPVFEPGWLTGTLLVPTLPLHAKTALIVWRNILEYEDGCAQSSQLRAYVSLISGLVNTKEDVLLLMKGDNPVLQEGFASLTREALLDIYSGIMIGQNYTNFSDWVAVADDINNYQKQKFRRMLLDILRTNFGKPWLGISVLAATILLVLTFLQAFYAIRTYYP